MLFTKDSSTNLQVTYCKQEDYWLYEMFALQVLTEVFRNKAFDKYTCKRS